MVEQIEADTHPLEGIVRKIRFSTAADKDEFKSDELPPDQVPGVAARQSQIQLQLTLAELRMPALLLTDNLKILWQNQSAIEKIWQDTPIFGSGHDSPSVFRLLFNANFQGLIENWRQWTAFFLANGLAMTSRKKIKAVIAAQDERSREELGALLAKKIPVVDKLPSLERLRLVRRNGNTDAYRIAALDVIQGRLLLFYSDAPGASEQSSLMTSAFPEGPGLVAEKPIYFMSTVLNRAETLQMEMLPKDYCALSTAVWNKGVETIEQFGGAVKSINNDALLACFMPGPGNECDPLGIIQCALELKSKMVEIGRQWKVRRGWQHRVELNIGLHFSHEFVGKVNSDTASGLTTFGNGYLAAECLSALAANGEIYASKDLIHRLSPEDLGRIRIGIFRLENQHRTFIERGFMRVKELNQASDLLDCGGIRHLTLVATQIFNS